MKPTTIISTAEIALTTLSAEAHVYRTTCEATPENAPKYRYEVTLDPVSGNGELFIFNHKNGLGKTVEGNIIAVKVRHQVERNGSLDYLQFSNPHTPDHMITVGVISSSFHATNAGSPTPAESVNDIQNHQSDDCGFLE